mmetsp:Transcript_15486/g.18003  ORF Transcript_15486/g.18003 Transcript_15486/m.18003 type:complete len:198 (+) Transcript_15486:106-699(+)
MKTAILAALVTSAAAFAPAQTGKASSALQESVFDNYVGAVDFRGKEMKWDPLNLSETYSPFQGFFREAELRHGRTAMLAVVGFIATDFVRIPGEAYSFETISKTADAHDLLFASGPMYNLLFWIGLFDLVITAPAIQAMSNGDREAGDFGWTKFAPTDKAKFDKKRESELMNGRLAMMAVGGIATQSIITGHGFPYV